MEIGEKLQRYLQRGSEKARGAAGKVETEVTSITDQIKEKHDQRREVEMLPMTREEVLLVCKRALREGLAKEFVANLLLPHLEGVQKKQVLFLWEPILSNFTNERRIGFWLYAILTDSLIDEAIKLLPSVGISEAERRKKLDQIDREIGGLEEKLEKLLS